MNLQHHVFKGSCDLMEESSSLIVVTLPGSVAIGIVVVEITFLIYHLASRDQVPKGLCNFVDGRFS